MTNEQLDEARAMEGVRLWQLCRDVNGPAHAVITARLAREGWTPPEPVDPDLIAVLEFLSKRHPGSNYYHGETAKTDALTQTCLAAYKAGRNQERERAKGLVDLLTPASDPKRVKYLMIPEGLARATLAKYRGEA